MKSISYYHRFARWLGRKMCAFSSSNDASRGFSLIEVNVAILVIAGGLLSLFTLFPAGLRMSTAALSDTRQALFADDFFAYFEEGVREITHRQDWENPDTFWIAARKGLEDGFGATFNNVDWDGDETVRKNWGVSSALNASDFKKGSIKATGEASGKFFLRFRNGVVPGYFTDNGAINRLDAEFLVRIASDYGSQTDGLIWRVSLVVSDDGVGGYYYNNPVYHRDFRFEELP